MEVCGTVRGKKRKKIDEVVLVWSEWSWLNTKINMKAPELADVVMCCLSVWWNSLPGPVQHSMQAHKKKKQRGGLYFVMSVFLSHFHKTCTGEGKAFSIEPEVFLRQAA